MFIHLCSFEEKKNMPNCCPETTNHTVTLDDMFFHYHKHTPSCIHTVLLQHIEHQTWMNLEIVPCQCNISSHLLNVWLKWTFCPWSWYPGSRENYCDKGQNAGPVECSWSTVIVQANRRVTVAQIAEKVNAGSYRKVSETIHCSLLHMGVHSYRLVSVPMLTPVHHHKWLQQVHLHPNWTTEQLKEVALFDESHFLLHHVDDWTYVHRLPGGEMAPGCTIGKRQAGRCSVMLWAMFCWDSLGPAIHVDVTLICNTHLNIASDQVHPFMEMLFPHGRGWWSRWVHW